MGHSSSFSADNKVVNIADIRCCILAVLSGVQLYRSDDQLYRFYQRVSIASYASAGIARAEMSVCPSVRHTLVLYQNEES